jgi:hypothetical protein
MLPPHPGLRHNKEKKDVFDVSNRGFRARTRFTHGYELAAPPGLKNENTTSLPLPPHPNTRLIACKYPIPLTVSGSR